MNIFLNAISRYSERNTTPKPGRERFSMGCMIVCALLSSQLAAVSAVNVVDSGGIFKQFDFSGTADGSVTDSTQTLNVTGGDMLIVMTSVLVETTGVIDGNTTMNFGSAAMTRLHDISSADGETVTSIFYLLNPAVGEGTLSITWDVDPTSTVPANSSFTTMSLLTLSNVNLDNPFGSMGTNANLSTGITLDSVEEGNLALYVVGASGGLGNPPVDINGATAVDYDGYVPLNRSERAGSHGLGVGAIAQDTGDLTISHPQTGRTAVAAAVEINTIPEPSAMTFIVIGVSGFLFRRRSVKG